MGGGGGGGGGGARVSEFFSKNPNLKKKIFFFLGGGGGGGGKGGGEGGGRGGGDLSKCIFFTMDPNLTKKSWGHNNVQVLSLTSSIYDHFIIWPSSVTLTFNVHKQMFWTALLLLEDNNCCKIILKAMHKCTSYGTDKLNLWPFWPLFDPYDLHLQPNWKNVSNGTSPPLMATTVQKYFEIHA